MSYLNIEIKARTLRADRIKEYLLEHGADYIGTDVQTDTYFNVPSGRLKLRQGNIENSLIFYNRSNTSGPRQSDFKLMPIAAGDELLSILSKAIGVKVAVRKSRDIFFIDNVKFHLDTLDGVGEFVEIEAMNKGDLTMEELHAQCGFYMAAFGIEEEDLIPVSYSDMVLSM